MIRKLLNCSLLGLCGMIYGQAGSLDTTFNGTGKLLTSFTATGSEEGQDVAVQADGKIVAVGYSYVNSSYDYAIVRYNTDGTLDSSFGTGGKVTKNISNYDQAYTVAINSDGKIYVGGTINGSSFYTPGNIGILRLNTDGTTDTTFGVNGIATITFPYDDYITSMMIQSDGKILMAGYNIPDATDNFADFTVARLNTDGTLDFDFSNDGKTTINFNDDDRARALAVDSSGNIYVGGTGDSNMCVARLFSDGTLDTSYATSGKANIKVNNKSGNLNDMKLLSDGSIVFTGYLFDTEYQMLIGKLTPAGILDTTFGTNGATVSDVDENSEDTAYSIVMQADGKFIISGRCYSSTTYYFAVLRYTAAGVLDTTFSNDGKVLTAFGTSWSMGLSSALQSDGKLVVFGYYGSFNSDFAIARYNTAAPLANSDFTKNTISLYPNPTNGLLNISYDETLANEDYVISDSLGRTVNKGIINNANTIDVSGQQSGLYILSVPAKSVSVKFIKS